MPDSREPPRCGAAIVKVLFYFPSSLARASNWCGVEREKKTFFFSFYTKRLRDQPPNLSAAPRREREREGKDQLLAALPWSFPFFAESAPLPTQSPASSTRCAPHSAADPSGDGGNEFHTPSMASQIRILISAGKGVDQRRSGSEWAYQE